MSEDKVIEIIKETAKNAMTVFEILQQYDVTPKQMFDFTVIMLAYAYKEDRELFESIIDFSKVLASLAVYKQFRDMLEDMWK